MSPQKDQYRPQTLKQAKKAYQIARAHPRFSELEMRRLQRISELQERADRLKKKEQKKKANLKKKEARKKAGMPDVEVHVAPSQLTLAFPSVRAERKKDEPCEDLVQPKKPTLNSMEPPPRSASRRPLQPLSPNLLIKSKAPVIATPIKGCTASIENWDDFLVSNTQVERELSTQRPKDPPPVCIAQPGPAIAQIDDPLDLLGMISTQDLICSVKGSSALLAVAVEDGVLKGNSIHEEREMATHDLEDSKQDFVPLPTAASSKKTYSSPPSLASTEDFGSDGIYTDDLKVLTQEFELNPAVKLKPEAENAAYDATSSASQKVLAAVGAADSIYDVDAPSSQELLALIGRNDFDEFEISTQDLRGLLP